MNRVSEGTNASSLRTCWKFDGFLLGTRIARMLYGWKSDSCIAQKLGNYIIE